MKQRRVDDGRRVARLDLAGSDPAHLEQAVVASPVAIVEARAGFGSRAELAGEGAGRRHDVIGFRGGG